MSSGRENRLTGQIGEYLVCAELGRRGLIATPSSGNVPTFDVLAADEQCRTVPIQVKASRRSSWPADARHWMHIELDRKLGIQRNLGPKEITNPELIYVCVAIGKMDIRDRFFILTRADLQKVCIAGYTSFMTKHDWKRPRNVNSCDCRYRATSLETFENNWKLIQERLQQSAPDHSLAQPDDTVE